ncbi:MAG: phosphodiester glycosidase family protein [Clostridiales bacterium]|nr:phosphodiester glycosidase family protein [Clostridiales bacterium]
MIKRILFTAAVLTAVSLSAGTARANAASSPEVFYEKKIQETIGKSVTYEVSKMVTAEGLLDVYVLKVPLGDPYIQILPIESLTEPDLKETTSKLVTDSGAIAGVNGDLFDMKGNYSSAIGPVIKNGKILSVDEETNAYNNSLSVCFIDNDGNPFMEYFKSSIQFLNNGAENIRVTAINKITDIAPAFPERAICINSDFWYDTGPLDARFPGLIKIVVQDKVITYISQPGELLPIPDNGYIVIASAAEASLAAVGQSAELVVRTSVALNNVRSGIGGQGKILENGELVSDGFVSASGRQPRTAIGYTGDGKQMILMVVDGRTHSIGATHEELGRLMQKYGAYNAMHLDGGGSSAFVTRELDARAPKLLNTPSGGAERKVANALGVFNTAPVGEMTGLYLKPRTTRIFQDTGVPVVIYGLDQYFHAIELSQDQVSLEFANVTGRFENGYFTPTAQGNVAITASKGPYSSTAYITVLELAELLPVIHSVKTGVGGRTLLEFNGRSKYGYSSYIYSGMQYEVFPPELGHMEGDYFVADSLGGGYIKCSVGGIVTYVDVNSGYYTTVVTAFDGAEPIQAVNYPDTVTGWLSFAPGAAADSTALALNYQFTESDQTQASYLAFDPPIVLPENAAALKLSVLGDNSYGWLRVRVLDGAGKAHTLDLAREIDWEGWRSVEAWLPNDIAYPVTLDRLYVAQLTNADTTEHVLAFDNMECVVSVSYETAEHPTGNVFSDPLRVALDRNEKNSFIISVAGNIALSGDKPDNYAETQQRVYGQLAQNSLCAVLAGTADLTGDIGITTVKRGHGYALYEKENVAILQMSAGSGGLFATNPRQWSNFTSDLLSGPADHVLVLLDKAPDNFTVAKEAEMLQTALKDIADTGKNIIVISTEGSHSGMTLNDSIRYINLGGLWSGGGINPDFRTLRLRVTNKMIEYDLQVLD